MSNKSVSRVGKTALVSALLGESHQAEKEEEGITITRCSATEAGDWSRDLEDLRPRVLTRSVKDGYQHSIAHTVATELAMVRENKRTASARTLDRERMSGATRSLTSFIRSNLKNRERSKERGRYKSKVREVIVRDQS